MFLFFPSFVFPPFQGRQDADLRVSSRPAGRCDSIESAVGDALEGRDGTFVATCNDARELECCSVRLSKHACLPLPPTQPPNLARAELGARGQPSVWLIDTGS